MTDTNGEETKEVAQSAQELAEDKARNSGWVPQEEWQGNPKDWVDAHHFNLRGELMGRIQNQTRQLKQYEKDHAELRLALKALGDHNKKLAEVQYGNIVEDLKARKKAALESDSHDEVMKLDDQIMEVKAEQTKLREISQTTDNNLTKNSVQQESIRPEIVEKFKEWVDRNNWYHTDSIRRGAANAIGDELLYSNPDMDLDSLFREVDKRLKAEFPHKYGEDSSPRRSGSAVDESSSGTRARGTSSTRPGKKYTERDLTSEERQVAKTLIAQGAIKDMAEYIKQYEMVQGFDGPRLGE